MVECCKCRHLNGAHNPACPKAKTGNERYPSEKDYEAGYQKGRAGDKKPVGRSSSYDLGYHEGVVALESAQNGHDPRFDQTPDLEEAAIVLSDFDELDGDPLKEYETYCRDTD